MSNHKEYSVVLNLVGRKHLLITFTEKPPFLKLRFIYLQIVILKNPLIAIKLKGNTENVPTQIHAFERGLCTQTQ